jgi:PRTRC genetic system protein C
MKRMTTLKTMIDKPKLEKMLLTNELPRIFRFENEKTPVELSDPKNTMTPEAVLNFYSATYPVLTTAKIEGPAIVNDRVEYKFVTTIGTKG